MPVSSAPPASSPSPPSASRRRHPRVHWRSVASLGLWTLAFFAVGSLLGHEPFTQGVFAPFVGVPTATVVNALFLVLFVAWHLRKVRTAEAQRAAAEVARAASEARCHVVLEAAPDALVISDASGAIVFVNARCEALSGYPAAALIGQPLHVLLPALAQRDGGPQEPELHPQREVMLRRADGVEVATEVSQSTCQAGAEHLVATAMRDITARRRVEHNLQASEQRYRHIVETSLEGVWVIDAQARTVFASGRMALMLGYTRDEMLGMTAFEFMDEASRTIVRAKIARRRLGIAECYELRFRRKDGRPLWTRVSVSPLLDAEGKFAGSLGMFQDITLERAAQEALAAAQRDFRQIIETAPDAIFIHRDLVVVYGNPAFERCVGHDTGAAAVGTHLQQLVHADDFGKLVAVLPEDGQASPAVEMRLLRRDGEAVVFECSPPRPIQFEGRLAFLHVARDVTERKKLEAQLLLSDRMASIGMLAAGVAHEINNPLAALMANLDIIQRDLGPVGAAVPAERRAPLDESLAEARAAATRMRHVVRDLRVFSRAETEQRHVVEVRHMLESSLRMARNEIRHRAQVVLDCAEVGLVHGNEARLGQVFLNLIMNAAQAIPVGAANRNEIRVSTRSGAGGEVVVEIADTGCGMAPEVVRRLFTPFFTTKPPGEGTGLGLSICHRIVDELGGRIEVESTPGQGSRFRVVLPAASLDEPAAAEIAPAPAAAQLPAQPEFRARVLVVDDDVAVGQAVRRLLEPAHDVVAVVSGAQALARVLAEERFDLLLCDVMMPDMSGPELHRAMTLRAPQQASQLVFITGGAFSPEARAYLDGVENPQLDKPLQIEALLALIGQRAGGRGP